MATADSSVHTQQLGPGDHGRMVSDDDFANAHFEEPWRYELDGGKLVVMCPNSPEHDDAAEPWREAFVLYKVAHRNRVQHVVPEAWVRLARGKSRIGDIAVYLVGERSSRRRPDRVPELVVEVVSPGAESWHRDVVEKRAEYHGLGVLEYVLVDYSARRVIVLTHVAGDYEERVLGPGDTYETPLLPGLAIDLDEVLVASDS